MHTATIAALWGADRGDLLELASCRPTLNSINDPVSGNKVQRNRADDSASSSSLTCTCVHITCMQYIHHHTDTLTQTDRQREGAGREGGGMA